MTAIPPNIDIPAIGELAEFRRWFHWRVVDGRKEPWRSSGEGRASSTKAATWVSFQTAAKRLNGESAGMAFALGEVLKGKWIVGIDVDLCRDPRTGEIMPWGRAIIDRLPTYFEVSPSGSGVKGYGYVDQLPDFGTDERGEPKRGAERTLPGPAAPGTEASGHKAPELGIYTAGRYFAVTGDHLEDTPDELADITEPLLELVHEHGMRASATVNGSRGPMELPPDPGELPPEIEALLANDRKFARAWHYGKKLGNGRDTSASGRDLSMAHYLRGVGLDDSVIAAALRRSPHGQVVNGGVKGWQVERRLRRILEALEPLKGPEASVPTDCLLDLSHDGLGLALSEQWHGKALHVALWGKWLLWRGHKWAMDERLAHLTMTRDYLRWRAASLVTAAHNGDIQSLSVEQAEAIAKTLRSAPTVAHVIGLARSNRDLAASVDDFDADPFMLGTPDPEDTP